MADQRDDALEPAGPPPVITPADAPSSDLAPTGSGTPTTTGPATTAPDEPATKTPPAGSAVKPARSRTGAVWVGIFVGTLVLIALIIFILQNTAEVEVHFLGWTGTAPLAIALLIAGVGVGLIALVVGTLRIAQLRRRLGAARKTSAQR